MLTAEFLEDLPEEIVDKWHECETTILCDMAERIKKKDYLIASSKWKIQKLKDIGLHEDYINSELSKMTGKSKEEVTRIMSKAFKVGLDDDMPRIRAGLDNPELKYDAAALNPIAKKGIKAVNNTINNFTGTYAAALSKTYENAIDLAFMQVQSGYLSKDQAVKLAVESLFNERDIPALVTKDGRIESISTVVSRAVRTGTNQAMGKIQLANMELLGADLVEVSSHYGARPEHAVWQGRVYSVSGKSKEYPDFKTSTGYGTGEGLCGWNCRHSFYPYFENESEKSFTRYDETKNNRIYAMQQKAKTLKNRVKHLTKKVKVLEAGSVDAGKDIVKLKKVQTVLNQIGDELNIPSFMQKKEPKTDNNILKKVWLKDPGVKNRIPQKIVDEINLGIDKMFGELPELKPYIQNIRVLENQSFFMAIETGLQNDKLISDFLINGSTFRSYEAFQEKLLDYKKIKYFASWTTIETLPLHEVGHLLESAIVDKYYPTENKMRIFKEHTVAKTILQDVAKRVNVDLNTEIQSISTYAKTNYSESFAEVMHKELSGKGNMFTKEVLKLCKSLLKK